jgi:hypothetical protein
MQIQGRERVTRRGSRLERGVGQAPRPVAFALRPCPGIHGIDLGVASLVVTVRNEGNPGTIGRPGRMGVGSKVVRQPPRIVAVYVDDIDVPVAALLDDKGELRTVG